jgi:hypothetical protein
MKPTLRRTFGSNPFRLGFGREGCQIVSMKLTEQINLDAAAKTARRAYRKNLPKAVRKASRASGWRCSQGDLFREMDGWFIFASLSVNLLRHETRLRFTAKPMKIDDIFWDITDLQENASQPLSFRVFGAWTCGCPSLYDAEIRESDDSSDLDDIATRFVAQSDKYLASIQSSTLEAVLQLCLGVPYPANYLAAEVARGRGERWIHVRASTVPGNGIGLVRR